jgi:drug/metabolite transporter (DMT)-like permease
VLAGCAFFLLARPSTSDAGARPDDLADLALLAMVFLIGGAVDLAMKVFAHSYGPSIGHPAFLVVVFGVAAVLGIAVIVGGRVRSGTWPGRESLWLGLVLGVVNYGSAAFMLRAAAELPASVVFPTNAVAVMVGAALLAVTLWGERLSRANVAGVVLAAAALVLLWGGREGGA